LDFVDQQQKVKTNKQKKNQNKTRIPLKKNY